MLPKMMKCPPCDDDDDDMAMAGDDDDDGDMMAMPMVTANGVGNLLKFGFWTTTYDRDTLLAVTNPGYDPANVNVKIVNGMGMPVATFTICLSAKAMCGQPASCQMGKGNPCWMS